MVKKVEKLNKKVEKVEEVEKVEGESLFIVLYQRASARSADKCFSSADGFVVRRTR